MATFATVAAAETRALAKGPAGDKTWLYAHSGRNAAGTPCVRIMRKQTTSLALTEVVWAELTDDGAV